MGYIFNFCHSPTITESIPEDYANCGPGYVAIAARGSVANREAADEGGAILSWVRIFAQRDELAAGK
jgi:hypothetical protein